MFRFIGLSFAILIGCLSACAQAVQGTWQGLLHGNAGAHKVVIVIAKSGSSYEGKFYNLDDGAEGEALSSVAIQGQTLTIQVSSYSERYVATLSSD